MANPKNKRAGEIGAEARRKSMALRAGLAAKYNTNIMAFGRQNIAATCRKFGIALNSLPPELLPKAKAGGTGIPLDAIPERMKPKKNGDLTYYARQKVKNAAGAGNPNEAVIMRAFDLLEKGELKDAMADRLIGVIEKLAGG